MPGRKRDEAGGTVAWVLPAVTDWSPVAAEFFGPEVAEIYRTSDGTGPLAGRLWHDFTVHDDDHNATLYTTYRTFGDVRPTSDVITMIEANRS